MCPAPMLSINDEFWELEKLDGYVVDVQGLASYV